MPNKLTGYLLDIKLINCFYTLLINYIIFQAVIQKCLWFQLLKCLFRIIVNWIFWGLGKMHCRNVITAGLTANYHYGRSFPYMIDMIDIGLLTFYPAVISTYLYMKVNIFGFLAVDLTHLIFYRQNNQWIRKIIISCSLTLKQTSLSVVSRRSERFPLLIFTYLFLLL